MSDIISFNTIFTGNIQRTSIQIAPRQDDSLEDGPMCGVTTGGKEECYWDCNIITTPLPSTFEKIITNPQCIEDCFQPNQVNAYETILSNMCNFT